MHQGSCHCGAVRLTLPSTPTVATDCNCSLCRRIGGPWVYFEFGTVAIEGHPQNTAEYIQGDRTLRTVRCRTCGCVTHWEPLDPKPGAKQGVHLGNFDPALLASVRVRKFDGADTWTFFDERPLVGPEGFAQRQLDAYNAHDLERFVAEYTDDVVAYRMPGADPVLVGKAAFAEHYRKNRFSLPRLHAELVKRMVIGNKVIDQERVIGVEPEPMDVAAIYEVTPDGIAKVWFLSAR